MKAVFLDTATFSDQIVLDTPEGVTDYQTYPTTTQDIDTIVKRCKEADIIITNKINITGELIDKLPNLKLVQVTATGTDNVDKNACNAKGISVQNVAGYSVDSVAEHTFMLMLGAMRAGGYYHQKTTDGSWQQDGKFCLVDMPIWDIKGRTLGIIGYGNIGERVAQIAKSFGMTVLKAERKNKPPRNDSYTAFDEVLAQADIITLHCPLTDDTRHLVNDEFIAKLGKNPLLINVARGAVVDSQSVVKALNDGKLLGYATDVFENEPFLKDEPLIAIQNHPRAFFTPHNAWASINAQNKLWQILKDNVSSFIKTYNTQ